MRSLRMFRGGLGSSRYDGVGCGCYILVVLGGFGGFGLSIHFSRCMVPFVLGMDQYIGGGMIMYKRVVWHYLIPFLFVCLVGVL